MTLVVTHTFVSAIADGGDNTLVRPSNWNANHTLTGVADLTQGGTGANITGTSGGVPYFNSSTTMASSGALTANAIVLGGGAGAAPTSMTGTSGGVPYFNASTTVTSSAALASGGLVFGGGAGAAPATSANLNWDNTNQALTITGATLTTSHPILNLSQGWNAGGVTFTGLLLNVTNTASGANSVLADVQVAGARAVAVAPVTNSASLPIIIFNDSGHGIGYTTNNLCFFAGTRLATVITDVAAFNGFRVPAQYAFSWSSSTANNTGADTAWFRDAAAGVVALGNQGSPTSATGLRVYNTTDNVATNTAPINYERGVFDWTTTANVLTIGAQAGGTGTGRAIRVVGGSAKAASLYNFGVAPVTDTSATYSVVDSDQWLIFNGSGSITVTLPAASSYTGREITMKTIAAQTVVSASSNVVPANSSTAGTAILAATAGKFATLVSDGSNWIIMQSN